MTDRLKGFIVTLDKDIREDDAQVIVNAIEALRHVLSVTPVVADFNDHINRKRVVYELQEKVMEVFREEHQ